MTENVQRTQDRTQERPDNIVMLLLSIVLLIIGIALLANPAGGMEVIMIIAGIALIAYGAITLISNAVRRIHGAGLYVLPALMLVAGILLIAFRGPAANIVLPLIIGIWAIVHGITNLARANRIRHEGGYWQASLILSVITIALGIIMLVAMFAGGNAVGAILGIILIVFAVVSIVQWFIHRSAVQRVSASE